MYPNRLFYIPQPSSTSFLSAPIASQSTYHLHPPVYPDTSPNYGEYNTDWGEEHTHTLLYIAEQMPGGELSAVGVAATTNGNTYRCRWHTGGIPCNLVFTQFDDLIDHLRHMHDVRGPADRKIVCRWLTDKGSCDKEYRRDRFRRHIGTHVGLSVSCTECGKPFSREDSMRAHRRRKHGKA